jgi:RNA polymerase sigma-70 factor (ECF subfamily)
MQVMAPEALWPQIEAIYRDEFARFARVARAVTGDRETALEAVQEGFADALRSATQWKGSGPLEGWIWRCVLNRARKARPMRSASLDEQVQTNGGGDEPDGRLRLHLAGLPERQRLVVFLRYFADLEYREIASALDIEVGTVGATLSAAHAALRTALEEVPA